MAKDKIRFRDLNWICKIGIVGGILETLLVLMGALYGIFAI